MNHSSLSPELSALRQWDTCAVANAIEKFDVRLRNEGFTNPSIRCWSPHFAPMIGYAVTVRIRCSSPPPDRHLYADRTDWWQHILAAPFPRVVVIQDVDVQPGTGAFIGEIHTHILQALGCVGAVTNGTVRDIPSIEKTGFHLFASGAVASHAYVHLVQVGGEVQVGGMKIKPGDLLHGDIHGVVKVPAALVSKLPSALAEDFEREQAIIALCQSPDFSLEKLRHAVLSFPVRDGHPD